MSPPSDHVPSFDAAHNTGREAIHSLSHIHALRKHYPRFAQAIQGLSGQSMDVADPSFAQDNPWMVPIHGLRRTYIYKHTISTQYSAITCLALRRSAIIITRYTYSMYLPRTEIKFINKNN